MAKSKKSKAKAKAEAAKDNGWGAKAAETEVPSLVIHDQFHLQVEVKGKSALSSRTLKYILLTIFLLLLAIGVLLLLNA